MDAGNRHAREGLHSGAYVRLAVMLLLSFAAMYVLMYAMVDKFEDVYPNHNQAYMAALMTAPMAIIEILLMGSMYPHKRANLVIAIGAVSPARRSLVRDPLPSGDRRRAVREVNDPASFRRHPDVRPSKPPGRRVAAALYANRRRAAGGDRPDARDPRTIRRGGLAPIPGSAPCPPRPASRCRARFPRR